MLISHPDRGYTLVELLVVVVLAGVVGAAVMRITVSQHRYLDAMRRIIETRRAVREGAEIPRYDLRAISPASGGIYAMAPQMIEFRSALGASVVCDMDYARTRVSIPSRGASSGLTAWIAPPRQGDTVLVFDATDSGITSWHAHVLAADPTFGATCPESTGFARDAVEAATALELQLTMPLAPSVGAGAALRFVRRARYQLYLAGGGRWYLGYLDCLASRAVPCSTIQPVSGPFPTDGIRFAFRDTSGGETSDPAGVARIDIVSRAETNVALRAAGFAHRVFTDSIVATIAPRN
ncbi:MAG TPA: prepilin-type N-terminal cleavage/methylation domain-containing protein [Gemmatimonadaceae bacterium]